MFAAITFSVWNHSGVTLLQIKQRQNEIRQKQRVLSRSVRLLYFAIDKSSYEDRSHEAKNDGSSRP